MKWQDYLNRTREIAKKEKSILQSLEIFDDIQKRAARSSLQILIENAIGKAKRILKQYNCPIVPKRSSDAISFLYEVGFFDEGEYRDYIKIIGFRNAMIHDYMDFDETILVDIVKEVKYDKVYKFLLDDVVLSETIQKRIKSFEL
jgi:uncharacterized protein YutE (UPF0331/DUF86 family)